MSRQFEYQLLAFLWMYMLCQVNANWWVEAMGLIVFVVNLWLAYLAGREDESK